MTTSPISVHPTALGLRRRLRARPPAVATALVAASLAGCHGSSAQTRDGSLREIEPACAIEVVSQRENAPEAEAAQPVIPLAPAATIKIRPIALRGPVRGSLEGVVFGRQPTAEYAEGTGRDHNSFGFTMWMAGGGIKGGTSIGQTDELGATGVDQRFHVKHLHATALACLGLDPNHLTYFYAGLDQKLVGVEGAEPIRDIMA